MARGHHGQQGLQLRFAATALDSGLTPNVKPRATLTYGRPSPARRSERRQALNHDASLILAPDGFNVSLDCCSETSPQ